MAKGITIESGSPRTLNLEGVEVATGGSANQAGLYAVGDKLYLDGEEIADASGVTGLLISDGELTFNGDAVGGGDTPPTPPTPTSRLWIPPAQAAVARNQWNTKQYIALYDALMTSSNYPGVIKKYEYRETQDGTKRLSNGSSYHDVPNMVPSFVEVQSGAYNDGNGAGCEGVPLYHYEFTPSGGYTKTYILEACIHGNEHEASQTLYRMMDIICNHANESAYSRFAQIRDNVRLIVTPVVNPWGHDRGSTVVGGEITVNGQGYMNTNYTDWDGHSTKVVKGETVYRNINTNRNVDFTHDFAINSGTGDGGNYPWQLAENRHIKATVERIGPKNIDYLFDYHDGGDPPKHFWFNYNMDGPNAAVSRQLLDDLIAYEEDLRLATGTDYRRPNGTDYQGEHYDPDEFGYIHPNVADQGGYSTGTVAAWAGITLGIPASSPEYIGGIFGYPTSGNFTSEQKTRSLRIRGNHLIYAYELCGKGWTIGESADAKYFHYDYGKGMTRQGMRADDVTLPDNTMIYDGVEYIQNYNRTTIAQVYDRWDALVAASPTYVTKSASLGHNYGGRDIYSYSLGNGSKKVLFIGGCMRWGAAHKETEYGMYLLAEYLCDDYIVNQSAFLQRLKQDYTIVVIPCIDIVAGGNQSGIHESGLNTNGTDVTSSRAKWTISNGKCVPKSYNNTSSPAVDVDIFTAWVAANTDALILVRGGEDTSGYALEVKKYETDIMTQFILPKNATAPDWLAGYCAHLEEDRGEDTPDVDHTNGRTSGDYLYDNYVIENRHIPTVYVNLKVSNKWAERRQYAQANDNAEHYMFRNYETGRRIANIVNIFLMAGGDIADGGGLVEKGGQ